VTLKARSRYRHLWLPAAWAAGAMLTSWGYRTGGFDPSAKQYGMNWPSDARRTLVILSVEVLVLYAVLRPWSYNASWSRAAIAFVLFASWTVLGGIGTMHSGRIGAWHWGWLLLVTLALLVASVVSAVSVTRSTRRSA
jgi:hypothetical protein